MLHFFYNINKKFNPCYIKLSKDLGLQIEATSVSVPDINDCTMQYDLRILIPNVSCMATIYVYKISFDAVEENHRINGYRQND